MGTSGPAARLYNPVGFAVMPGTLARSSVLGVLYLPVFPLFYFLLQEATAGTTAGPAVEGFRETVGWAGITGIGFTIPIGFTLFLAWLGYRRREYEVGPNGVTERRGILLRSEQFLGYDVFEGVTVTQSRVQSIYGCGTVRLTDVNQDGEEQLVMKMSYVRNPRDVSTTILRHLTDVTGATDGELDTAGVEALSVDAESISRVSGDTLAAGTGGRYLMPSAILHPAPTKAAIHGAVLGLVYAAVGTAIVFYFQDLMMDLTGLPSLLHLAGSVGAGAVVLSAAMAGYMYWIHDRTQYELYADHLKVLRGDETTTYSLEDVAGVRLADETMLSLQRGGVLVLPGADVGNIELYDDVNDTVVEFAFITDVGAVFGALEEWLGSARNREESGNEGWTPDSDSPADSAE